MKARPLQWRAILPDHVAGLIAVLFVVLQENLDRLDGHGAVAKDGQTRNLSRLHQMLEDENKLLSPFNRKRRNDHAAAAPGGCRNEFRKFRQWIFFGMNPVAIGRFHHNQIGGLALGGTGGQYLSRRRLVVSQAPNDSGQVNSRPRGVNRSAESFFYEAGKPAVVVEVSVRQDDRINFLGRNRRAAPVALAPFFRALKEAAIDENLDAVFLRRVSRIDQMLRAGDRFRGAQKLDVGQAFPPGLTINPPARTVSPW